MALSWVDFTWSMKRWMTLHPTTSVNGVEISGSDTPSLSVSGSASVSGTNTGDQTLESLGLENVQATLVQMQARIDELERNLANLGFFLLDQGIEIPEEIINDEGH